MDARHGANRNGCRALRIGIDSQEQRKEGLRGCEEEEREPSFVCCSERRVCIHPAPARRDFLVLCSHSSQGKHGGERFTVGNYLHHPALSLSIHLLRLLLPSPAASILRIPVNQLLHQQLHLQARMMVNQIKSIKFKEGPGRTLIIPRRVLFIGATVQRSSCPSSRPPGACRSSEGTHSQGTSWARYVVTLTWPMRAECGRDLRPYSLQSTLAAERHPSAR